MTFKNVLEDLKRLNSTHKGIAARIKSHNLSVIVFGAGEMAKWVSEHFLNNGVEIFGYAVDDEYFKSEQTCLGRPIYRFSEVREHSKDYVFVLGMEDEMQGGNRAFEFLCDDEIVCYPLPINLKNSVEPVEYEDIFNLRDEYEELFSLLEDEISRQTLANYFKLKITGDYKWNLYNYVPNPYFNELVASKIGGGYIDCGAYVGDTIEKFIKWSGGNYKKIFAIEANNDNFIKLKNFVHEKNYKNVEVFGCGVWNKKGTLFFDGRLEKTHVSSSGNDSIAVDTLDNLVADEQIDFIKMEVQGSEVQGLQGAASVIKNQKPAIATAVFHKKNELIDVSQLLRKIRYDYKFYLRKHTRIRDNGLILYAV